MTAVAAVDTTIKTIFSKEVFMNRYLNYLFGLSLFLFVICGFTGSASAQPPCAVEICKSAPGSGMQGFLIDFTDSGQTETVELFDGGDCITTLLNFNADVDITEQPTPGWTLDNVTCDPSSGISITDISGGIVALCTTEAETSTTCTFNNVPGSSVTNVPTLSEWGMIAAAAGLVLVGVFFAVRRKKRSTMQDA
jgi:hypothetical protein